MPLHSLDARRQYILDTLDQQGQVSVNDLAKYLNVSKVTIRNDLDFLERNGRLKRIHGGAAALTQRVIISLQDKRMTINAQAKRRIAKQASNLVEDGDVLMVDSGTTALEFIKTLGKKRHLTVITADLTIADTIDRMYEDMEVIMLGGTLRSAHRYTAGPVAMATLATLYANKAFICPTSYISNKGLMTNYPPMAEIKKGFISNAEKNYLLLDASKINQAGLISFGTLDLFDAVISDCSSESLLYEDAQEAHIQFLCA